MNVKQTAREIVNQLRASANPRRREATQNYFPSAQTILGVYTADIRALVRKHRKPLVDQGRDTVLALARAIIAENTLEGRQVAVELVAQHKATMAAITLAEVEALGRGMDNWASVDGFCCCIAGVAWRDGRIRDADVHRWARSKDPWWRRAALVCTVPLNTRSKGGKGDASRTLKVCRKLAADQHIMVHKALSWALRQLVSHDKAAVAKFLKDHPKLPALVRREVNRKLTTGRKNG
ncbi:MAG: DNA alkylation repair protein [Planctomycetes bacterium]|nr:DNA alkylation repair protein [Planctomycetota bacterium]